MRETTFRPMLGFRVICAVWLAGCSGSDVDRHHGADVAYETTGAVTLDLVRDVKGSSRTTGERLIMKWSLEMILQVDIYNSTSHPFTLITKKDGKYSGRLQVMLYRNGRMVLNPDMETMDWPHTYRTIGPDETFSHMDPLNAPWRLGGCVKPGVYEVRIEYFVPPGERETAASLEKRFELQVVE